MAQTIKLKRSATASAIPSTAQLALGEIAINTFDGKLYLKKDNGTESVVEVLTTTGDGSGLTLAAPSAPSITSISIISDTIELVFSESATSGVNRYEIWSDGAGTAFSLIGIIPDTDIASSMSFIDASFTDTGTINYRIHAVRNGVYSSAATTNISFSNPSLDVTNFSAIPGLNTFYLEYEVPTSRFLDHIEIYMDTNASSGSLLRANANLIYSGQNSSYTHNISASDRDSYHQFWVECV
jgi:hypothetical protein